MTSLITEYRSTEDSIRELTARLESLKNNPKLQNEIEFEAKLRELLGTYGKSLRDVILILDPQSKVGAGQKPSTGKQGHRAPRQLKRYKNPHTGEVVETKGGNHKTLNHWKSQHGADAVKSWIE